MQVLNEIRGLSEAKISKMVEAAKKLCPTQNGFMTAKECEIMREQMIGKLELADFTTAMHSFHP